jgi:hypothetical protein
VVQLLISDFDRESVEDMEDLSDPSFLVHCLLVSSTDPAEDVSAVTFRDPAGDAARTERMLVGNLTASPFFCAEDPDPDTSPRHPSLQLYCPTDTPPVDPRSQPIPPATVFCFPDLSIRSTGTYRLKFQLLHLTMRGEFAPADCSVLTAPFKVSGAKEFDHVQASTPLIRGLIAQGAGFPLKLKQGSRA